MEKKLESHSRGKKNESQLSNGISDTLIRIRYVRAMFRGEGVLYGRVGETSGC